MSNLIVAGSVVGLTLAFMAYVHISFEYASGRDWRGREKL